MGFSLKAFFSQLEDLINDKTLSLGAKYELMLELIDFQKQYAKDCGQL